MPEVKTIESAASKECNGLNKFLNEEGAKEISQMGFNGAFVAVPITCFETVNALMNTLDFETAIVNDKGSMALQYVTPGSVFPQLPVRLIMDSNQELCNAPARKLMDDVIVLKGGNKLDKVDDVMPRPEGLKDDDLERLFENFKKVELNTKDDPRGCLQDLELTAPVSGFTRKIFEDYFPNVNPEDYLLYFTADTLTMVSIGLKGALGDEENINSFNKMKNNSATCADDEVYVGDETFEVVMDNSRLESGLAYFRPVYQGRNEVYTNRAAKEDIYGREYDGKVNVAKNPVLKDFNSIFDRLAVDKSTAKKVPMNDFFWSMASSLVMTTIPTPFAVTNNKNEYKRGGLVNRLRVIKDAGILTVKPRSDISLTSKNVFTTAMMSYFRESVVSPPTLYTYREDGKGEDVIKGQVKTKDLKMPFVPTSRGCLINNIAITKEMAVAADMSREMICLVNYYSDSLKKVAELLDLNGHIVHMNTTKTSGEFKKDLTGSSEPEKKAGIGEAFRIILKYGLDYKDSEKKNPIFELLTMFCCNLGAFKSSFVRRALSLFKCKADLIPDNLKIPHPATGEDVCATCGTEFVNSEASSCFCYLALKSATVLVPGKPLCGRTAVVFWEKFFFHPTPPKNIRDCNFSYNCGLRINESRSNDTYFGDSRIAHDETRSHGFMSKDEIEAANKKAAEKSVEDSEFMDTIRKTKKLDDLTRDVINKTGSAVPEIYIKEVDEDGENLSEEQKKMVNRKRHVGEFSTGFNKNESVGLKELDIRKIILTELCKDNQVSTDYTVPPLFPGGTRFTVKGTMELEEEEDDGKDSLFTALGEKRSRTGGEPKPKRSKNTISMGKKLARAIIYYIVEHGEIPNVLTINEDYVYVFSRKNEYVKMLCEYQKLVMNTEDGAELQKSVMKEYLNALAHGVRKVHKITAECLGFEELNKFDAAAENHMMLSGEKVVRKLTAFADPASTSCRIQKRVERLLLNMATAQAYDVKQEKNSGNNTLARSTLSANYLNSKDFAVFNSTTTLEAPYVMPMVVNRGGDVARYSVSTDCTPPRDGGDCMNAPDKIKYVVTFPPKVSPKMDVFASEGFDIDREKWGEGEEKLTVALNEEIQKVRDKKRPDKGYISFDLVRGAGKVEKLVPSALLMEFLRKSNFSLSKAGSDEIIVNDGEKTAKEVMDYLKYCTDHSESTPTVVSFLLRDFEDILGMFTSIGLSAAGFASQRLPSKQAVYKKMIQTAVPKTKAFNTLFNEEEHLAAFLHAYCAIAEVYGFKGKVSSGTFNRHYERETNFIIMTLSASLRLYCADEHCNTVRAARKFGVRQRSMKPIKTIVMDKVIGSGSDIIYSSFSNVPTGSISDAIVSIKLGSYPGQDGETVFTKFKIAPTYNKNSLITRIVNQIPADRNVVTLIKRPVIRVKPYIKNTFTVTVEEVSRETNIDVIIRYIIQKSVSAKELALYYAKNLGYPVSEDGKSVSVDVNQGEFLDNLAETFLPDYAEGYRRMSLEKELGKHILPHIFSSYAIEEDMETDDTDGDDWINDMFGADLGVEDEDE